MARTTLKIYPNERKQSKTTGKFPLYLRLSRDRKKTEARLDWEITRKELKAWNEKIGMVEFETITNDFINSVIGKFSQLKFAGTRTLNDMSLNEIRDHLLGQENNERLTTPILLYAENYFKSNVSNNSKFTDGTKKNYRKSINHLKKFIAQRKSGSIVIKDLDYPFASEVKSYLLNDDPEMGKEGMSEVSAHAVVKNYRTIFNEAVAEGIISVNPFTKIKLSNRSPEKPRLSANQLSKMYNHEEFDLYETRCLCVFLFMSFTGCAYQDAQDLTYSKNIEINGKGTKLTYRRNKTDQESIQFLTEPAVQILNEFSAQNSSSNKLLPTFSNAHLNRILKIIGLKAGINFRLTTHTARHTYRQLLDEADIVDPSVIRKHMGWSNRSSMDSIYRVVTDSRLLKTKEQLDAFLNRTLSPKTL